MKDLKGTKTEQNLKEAFESLRMPEAERKEWMIR